jgi:type I restriction enzyme S subunit
MMTRWEIKKLGDVCELYQPKTISSKDMVEDGEFSVFGANGIIGKYDKYNHEEPQLLITCRGATCGTVNISEPKSWINGNAMVVRPYNKTLDLKYVEYLFRGVIDISKIITGAAQPQITRQSLSPVLIPTPTLPEQQRIVSILDEAFAAIDTAKANAEKNLKNAKELFESYLQGVFENKGDGWQEMNLETVVEDTCTLSYGIVQPGEEFEKGLPIIRPTDMTKRFIGLNGLKRINPVLAEGYKRTKLRGDELLVCVRGTTGLVSNVTIDLKDANVTRGIVPIRFNPNVIFQDFGYYLLISQYVQSQIKSKTYGAALMQINIGDLRKISTPFPSLSTQQILVEKLDALSAETKRLESIYQQKLTDIEELKKSILQKAFNGELNTTDICV